MGVCKSPEVEKVQCSTGVEGKLGKRMALSDGWNIHAVSHKQDDHPSGLPWEALLI